MNKTTIIGLDVLKLNAFIISYQYQIIFEDYNLWSKYDFPKSTIIFHL